MDYHQHVRKLVKQILSEEEGLNAPSIEENPYTSYYKKRMDLADNFLFNMNDIAMDTELPCNNRIERILLLFMKYAQDRIGVKSPELNENYVRYLIRQTINEEESKSSNAFSNDDKKLLELPNGMLMAVYDAATNGVVPPEERINNMVNLFQRYSQEKSGLKPTAE